MKDIIQDLVDWSGLPEKLVDIMVNRGMDDVAQNMFNCLDFKAPNNIYWFYRTASLYHFQCAQHNFWPVLDQIKKGPVLDYGGGLGNNFFPLLKQGLSVDFFDISYFCIDFVKWKINNRDFAQYPHTILSPFVNGKFDPVNCFNSRAYNAIIFESVLEHMYNYEELLDSAIASLNPEGLIFIIAPFGSGGDSFHLQEKTPIQLIMEDNGMIRKSTTVWEKPLKVI